MFEKKEAAELAQKMIKNARDGYSLSLLAPFGVTIKGFPYITAGYGDLEGKMVVQWDNIPPADPGMKIFDGNENDKIIECVTKMLMTFDFECPERNRERKTNKFKSNLFSQL